MKALLGTKWFISKIIACNKPMHNIKMVESVKIFVKKVVLAIMIIRQKFHMKVNVMFYNF